MSLDAAGAKKKPKHPSTHKPVDMTRLMKLAGELEDIATDGLISEHALTELAEYNGVAAQLYYAALPLCDAELVSTEGPRFVVCVGGCQGWGALPCLESLLDLRSNDGPNFSIQVRECLDHCDKAAAMELHTDGGKALLANVTAASLAEAVSSLR